MRMTVAPNAEQLVKIAELVDSGTLKVNISETIELRILLVRMLKVKPEILTVKY